MKTLLFALPALLVLASCGQPSSSSRPEKLIIANQQFANDYIPLTKQTTSCQSKSFQHFSKSLSLNLFLEGAHTKKSKDFSPLLQGLFLKDGKSISYVTYGEKIELVTDVGQGTQYEQVLAKPREVNLCPREEYEDNTVESAALNASYYIQKTNLKIASVAPTVYIKPITISIAPVVQVSYVVKDKSKENIKLTQYMTDNAFYSVDGNMIVFLPQSTATKENFPMSFWEVPMVASHEYGHHIFNMIAPKLNDSISSLKHNCFGHAHISPNVEEMTNQPQRTPTVSEVIGALNEGFADLISYYSLDKNERGVQDVTCLKVTRDVGSSLFLNGSLKVFSSEVLDNFFSTTANHSSGCEQVNYQEIHTIGAIFAHTADKFLSKLTTSDDQKLVAVIEWIKYLNQSNNSASASPEEYLHSALEGFISMGLNKFNKKVSAETCSLVKEVYPEVKIAECASF